MPTPAPSLVAPQALTDLSGTVLASSYRLGRVLGAGGMGAVFEATQLSLGRKVAIKVLRPVFVGHEEFTRRFVREAKAAASIEHPNVVEIIDVNEAAGGLVFTVMKFLDGQDLEAYLRAQPDQRLPWAKACGLLAQVAAGLKAAHERGVIHRDIKPANCFLTTGPDGIPLVKVVDFGIAKLDDADQTQQLTGTAEVLGTPAYIAPELVRTKSPASPRSDIYSLGVLAYRMLAGRVPFTGETHFEVLHHSCFDPVPPLGDRVSDLPPAVESLVLQMLAKEPDRRPQSMQAVRDALLSLGRDTLGPTAVEISGSAAIAIGVSPSNDTPEPNKTTPLPISGDVLAASRTPAALDSTEVLPTPAPSALGLPGDAVSRTMVVSSAERAPKKEGVDTDVTPGPGTELTPMPAFSQPYVIPASLARDAGSGAMSRMVGRVDLGSGPPPDTPPEREPLSEPNVGNATGISSEPTPPRTEAEARTGSPRPRRSWLPVALISTLVIGGLGLGWKLLGDTDGARPTSSEGAPAEVVAVQTPTPSATPSKPSPSEAPRVSSVSTPVEPTSPVEPDLTGPAQKATEQAIPTPGPPSVAHPGPEAAAARREASPRSKPTSKPSSSKPNSDKSKPPSPKADPKPVEAVKPVGAPADVVQKNKLKLNIESKCGEALQGKPTKIEFMVGIDGKATSVLSDSEEVRKCAAPIIKAVTFRERPTRELVSITVG